MKSIEELFDLIDDDKSDTISLSELKQAIIRFDLNLTDR
jgi:Ca2+-binding EF-hand superfamily protein